MTSSCHACSVDPDRAEEVLSTSLEGELVTLGSEDLLEALDAFKEKRPGAFKGR